MARFYKRTKPLIKSDVNWFGHFLEGSTFIVRSSSGNGSYKIEVGPHGPTCECVGFSFYGSCRHIKDFVQKLETE